MINIILDPLLIFGIGPFPEMGIRGAALATGIGQTTGLCIYLLTSRIKPLNLQFKMQYFKPDKNICRRLYGIGIPATLNMALPSFLISALNILLAHSQIHKCLFLVSTINCKVSCIFLLMV